MSQLFTSVQVGSVVLNHRVPMAPLTRMRAEQPSDVPNDMMVEYYAQRVSEGGLIITRTMDPSPWRNLGEKRHAPDKRRQQGLSRSSFNMRGYRS
jgi:2,4-dienoyl-CoA reductase-like NADH-dependent reductase (Old Yellow Enzyme family)